jgi:DNA-binding GntR family transcriptional regulator
MSTHLTTLGQQAYQTMRQMIMRGELPAGHWLRKRSLALRLQMSATPVVEALRKLEHEGLVDTQPQWGARVRAFTVKEIEELAGMRVMLESFVARKAAERLKPHQLADMRELALRVDEADRKQSDPALLSRPPVDSRAYEIDHEFHLTLAIETDLPLVHREIDRLQVLKATCRMFIAPAPQSSVTHVQIIDAIATGDPELAERTMRRHIQSSVEGFLPVLRKRFGDGPVIAKTPVRPSQRK